MNNKRRKTRELNRLSAYLDNALSARQMRNLEARLAVDPELQEKMDNLRKTKLALSRLERLKAPRNFTLTPDMVPERSPRRQPLQGALRLASALAAILLVVLFSVEFILGQIPQPQMLAAEAPMMEAASVADESSPEPLIQWGPPGTGGEVGGMGGVSPAMEQPMLEAESMPEEEPDPEIESLPQEQPEIMEEESGEKESPASKGGELILGINQDEAGEIIGRSEPAPVQPEPAILPWPEILDWAQIALAVIAVGGGLMFFIIRKQSQS